jgi:hypothetical protein
MQIVDAIFEYPPLAIDISGGDPLLVSLSTHQYLVDVLTNAGVQVKIIINPKSFNTKQYWDKNLSILKLYNWIGISINTNEELEIAKTLPKSINNYTIITNFNLENIFLFDEIKNFVKAQKRMWQIQYTMYEEENSLALYGPNTNAREFFFNNIEKALSEGVNIVMADNMTNGPCGAGASSLGILSDGTVVPCLSMRSWVSNMEDLSQGNILTRGLEAIWWDGFENYRFEDFKCCKDHCDNKAFCPKQKDRPLLTVTEPLDQDEYLPLSPYPPNNYPYGVVTMYAVQVPSTTVVYGVQPSGPYYVYGVTRTHTNTKWENIINNTTINNNKE